MKQTLKQEHLHILRSTLLFGALPPKLLESVVDDFQVRSYQRGNTIFNQGDEGKAIYIVFTGLIRIYHLNQEGNRTTVNFFEDGEIFGEFAVIDDKPRSATAEATTDVILLEMRGHRIAYHLQETPGMALAMCKQLVQKVRVTSQYAETLAQHNAKESLFSELLRYANKFGRVDETGQRCVLDLGLTQEELGTLIGKGRTTVNPILQDARRRGLLEFERGTITILDIPRLSAEARQHDFP